MKNQSYKDYKEALKKVPEFVKGIKEAKKEKDCIMLLHQDAFGADYQSTELYLLGAVVKFAGELGVEIRIIGKNRETLK